MGSLLDLVLQSLVHVLEALALKEAMLAVILGSSTLEVARSLMQMEAVKITTGGVMARQELSHHGRGLQWETLSPANGTCVHRHN